MFTVNREKHQNVHRLSTETIRNVINDVWKILSDANCISHTADNVTETQNIKYILEVSKLQITHILF